jgi:hypothetical protein
VTFPSDVTLGTGTAVSFPSDVTLGTGIAIILGLSSASVTPFLFVVLMAFLCLNEPLPRPMVVCSVSVSSRAFLRLSEPLPRPMVVCSTSVSPFPRGGDSRDVGNHGEPRRGKGSRAIPKSLRRAVFPRSKLSLLPTIGERFGEWFEVLLRTRRMRWL